MPNEPDAIQPMCDGQRSLLPGSPAALADEARPTSGGAFRRGRSGRGRAEKGVACPTRSTPLPANAGLDRNRPSSL